MIFLFSEPCGALWSPCVLVFLTPLVGEATEQKASRAGTGSRKGKPEEEAERGSRKGKPEGE